MKLQANDKSYQALTVGSLNVLGNISGSAMQSIHTHLQTAQAANAKIQAGMERLYQSISSDGLISPAEKLLLKKEMAIIETEYPIVTHRAEKNKQKPEDITAYKDAYRALIQYIYTDIKLFDDMESSTEIERSIFDKKFNTHYKALTVLQVSKDGFVSSFPNQVCGAVCFNFDENARYVPSAKPAYTAWKSSIIEYDVTGKDEIRMSFADALCAVIILKGSLNADIPFYLYFDETNGNGAKQYQCVYRVTGSGDITITTGKSGSRTIVQKMEAATYGTGSYITVDTQGNVWAFSGRLKDEDVSRVLEDAKTSTTAIVQNITNEYKNNVDTFVFTKKSELETLIQSKIDEVNNAAADRFVKESGQLGEVRYFTSKNYTYGFLYANGYAFIPALYPEYYQFWLENFGDPKKKNYLGYDRFGYPKLPDLRGVSLRAVDDGTGRGGASEALEFQGDAIRNIKGNFGRMLGYSVGDTSPFYQHSHVEGESWCVTVGHQGYYTHVGFDASRVVPTASENRVKSYAVYPFIKVI